MARCAHLIHRSEQAPLNLSLRGARQCDEAILSLRRLLRACSARNDMTKERVLHLRLAIDGAGVAAYVPLLRPSTRHSPFLPNSNQE